MRFKNASGKRNLIWQAVSALAHESKSADG
jgi:hypothetical protein